MSEHWKIVYEGGIMVADTAEKFSQKAASYFLFCDSNPIITKTTIKSGKGAGQKVTEEHPRPYSIKGLCLHCGVEEEWLRDVRKTKNSSSHWYAVVSKVLYIIYTQNLEYAMTGIFSPVFTAKVLGMEKEETPTGGVKVEIINAGIPELSESENQILEKLELEIGSSQKDERANS